jgi:hypothetical protein
MRWFFSRKYENKPLNLSSKTAKKKKGVRGAAQWYTRPYVQSPAPQKKLRQNVSCSVL